MISTAVPRITAMFNINTIYKESTVKNSMTVAEVASIMNKTPSFVRIGLQRGTLPFGTAQIMPRSNKYTYYISPALFYAYIGQPLPEKYKEKEENTNTNNQYQVITEPVSNISWNWRG